MVIYRYLLFLSILSKHFSQNIFKRPIPFYKDFVLLNDLIESNSEILFMDLESTHSIHQEKLYLM